LRGRFSACRRRRVWLGVQRRLRQYLGGTGAQRDRRSDHQSNAYLRGFAHESPSPTGPICYRCGYLWTSADFTARQPQYSALRSSSSCISASIKAELSRSRSDGRGRQHCHRQSADHAGRLSDPHRDPATRPRLPRDPQRAQFGGRRRSRQRSSPSGGFGRRRL
jgi:hypothetical protein